MKGKLTITKNSRNVINVTLRDEKSRIRFVTATISRTNFADALFGLSEVECDIKVKGLVNVGRKKVTKSLEFKMDLVDDDYGDVRKDRALEIARSHCGYEWSVWDTRFSSQTSFFDKDGELWARTSLYKFI